MSVGPAWDDYGPAFDDDYPSAMELAWDDFVDGQVAAERESFDAHYGDEIAGNVEPEGDDFPVGDRTNEIRNAPGQLRFSFGVALG